MISRNFLIFLLFLTGLSNNKTFGQPDQKGDISGTTQSIQVTRIPIDSITNPRYARSFQGPEGNIFVQGQVKIKKNKDGQYVASSVATSLFPSEAIKEGAMNSFYSQPGFFIALSYRINYDSGIFYAANVWRSYDDMKTVDVIKARFILPEAGKVDYGTNGEWAGLFCHRGIIRLSDNSLLAAVYGNFECDTITPDNPQSKLETKYKLRAFVVRSVDEGSTWNYLSSIAVPQLGHPDDTEGFNEWNMVQLNDGRILAVIRTGHFTPPVLSFSADQGRTWSRPVINADLGPAACDPCLIKLSDGRIALSYGEMVQPVGDRKQFFEHFNAGDHLRRCRLAISTTPDADHWQTWNISDYGDRSAYSTIFQVEPGILIYQSGDEVYQVRLNR